MKIKYDIESYFSFSAKRNILPARCLLPIEIVHTQAHFIDFTNGGVVYRLILTWNFFSLFN